MNQGLSKREKILIFIAVIVVLVFVAFQFLIMPSYNRYTAKLDEYNNLDYEKELLDMKFQSEELTRNNYIDFEQDFMEIKERYPAVMSNEELDRMMTGLCLENKLNPVMLEISVEDTPEEETEVQTESGAAQTDPTEAQTEEQTDSAEEQADSTEAQTDEQASQKAAPFVVTTVTMNLSGSYNSMKGLIDTVEGIDYIQISQISYAIEKDTGTPSDSNISVIFEVTMLTETQ